MALSRTWYSDGNIALSDTSTAALSHKSIMWGWKALLKGEIGTNTHGLWTCVGSSDSSTAGMDNSDRWGSSFDASKVVRSSSGAHSWIVLKSPIALGPYYLCIDLSGTTEVKGNIITAKTAFTGGTTSARPTSTDEWSHFGDMNIADNTALPQKIHRITDADGNFWVLLSHNTSGIFYFMFGLQTLTQTKTLDVTKVITAHSYLLTGRGCGLMDCSASSFAGTAAVGGATRGRLFNNTATNSMSAISYYTGASANWSSQMTTSDAADGLHIALPVYIYSPTTDYKGIKGALPDVSIINQGMAVGSVVPSSGTQERMVVGDLLIPSSFVPLIS